MNMNMNNNNKFKSLVAISPSLGLSYSYLGYPYIPFRGLGISEALNLPGISRFYSTSFSSTSKSEQCNPLIFKCNNVYRRHLYKLNPLNKLFYTTEQSNINHKVGL